MTLKWDIPIPIGNGAAYDFGVPLAIFTVRHGFAFWHSWHVRIIPLRVSFSLNAERHKWIGHFEPKKKWTHEKWNETNIELKLRRRGERRKPKWRFVCDKQIDENGYKSFGFFHSYFFVLICLEVPWPNIGMVKIGMKFVHMKYEERFGSKKSISDAFNVWLRRPKVGFWHRSSNQVIPCATRLNQFFPPKFMQKKKLNENFLTDDVIWLLCVK